MDDKVCGLLSEVDEYFNKGVVNERKFNKNSSLKNNCPYENNSNQPKCTNNNDRTSALCAYLHNKISEIDKYFKDGANSDKRHIEIFIIWLGDKLFKMDNDYKATLEESYKKNLENHVGNYNYWKVMDSKKFYKKATIKKMSEYYNLINYICKLITEYNKNPDNPRLGNYSSQCGNYYKTIYNSINGCKPYLQLLDDLKMVYEIFRMQKISNNYNINENKRKRLLNRVKSLTTFQNVNQYFVTVNPILSFDDKECVDVRSNDEKIGERIASQKSKAPIRGGQPRVSGNTQHGNTGSRHPASLQPKRLPAQPPTLKSPPAKPAAVKPAPPPQSLPSAPSQTDTKLKTHQAGQTHQNGPGDAGSGAVGGKGGTSGGKGGTSGEKGGTSGEKGGTSGGLVDGSGGKGAEKKDINRGLGSDKGSSTQVGKDGGQKSSNSDTRGPVNVPGSGAHGSGGAGVKSGDQGVKGSQKSIDSGTNGEQGSPSSGASGKQGSQGTTSSESGGSSGGAGGGKGDAGSGGGSAQDDQGKSPDRTGSVQGGQAKGPGDPPGGNPVPAQSAPAPSGTGTTPSSQSSTGLQSPPVPSTPQSPTPQVPTTPGTTSQVPTPPGTIPSPGASQPQVQQGTPPADPPVPPGQPPQTGGSSSGSKDTGDGSSDPASNTSGGSFDWGSSIFEFILKGKEYYNKASEFIKDNQQKFKDAAEKISGAYNDTVDNLKSAYNASSGYVNNLINDVIDQFNQTDPPSKQNGNHSGTGNPPGVGNPSNQLPPSQPQNTPDPPTSSKNTSSDPASNQQPNSLSMPSKDPLPTTPTDPSKGSQPPSPQAPPPATPPGPPKVSSQQIQSPPQPHPITQQPAHVPAQVNQPNSQKIGQLIKSLSSDIILKKPWNIFPTTWNGSGGCKPEIKFMNATLVCCTYEQCSLTGITVTLVLIPIILLIAYKYLSFGSSKKSEKKNMKRVINFHDGNRKTKIIISSNNKNKDLKPVINLVGGKKDSLINIYKIIQADPMPFINLFFLLIFFVYKRKRDTIE
ncbi:PIR protein CIR protein [Plasmodium vinckei]|uniref:PIR protein CIR protein n=1 Tax=Plasmodium vinckei TaxID=5860 RepID=A0A6V7SHP7_PLAVN|nr:PIR protein CIR protein [Plasmodium vinckei]